VDIAIIVGCIVIVVAVVTGIAIFFINKLNPRT